MQGETVLRLADGRAVHQHPWLQDRLFDTLQAALDHCGGTTWQSEAEFIAWADGYNTQSLVDLIAAQLDRFDARDEFFANGPNRRGGNRNRLSPHCYCYRSHWRA